MENRIEPLHMANLERATLALRQFDQFTSLGRIVGHRFLNQDVFALLESGFYYLKMSRSRGHHTQGLTAFQRLSQRADGPNPIFLGQLPGSVGHNVVNSS